MEGGELGVESMETLTELGDELTLGDIDGGRRGKGAGGRGRAWAPPRGVGGKASCAGPGLLVPPGGGRVRR